LDYLIRFGILFVSDSLTCVITCGKMVDVSAGTLLPMAEI